MIDLFTARPVVRQQPTVIHRIADDDAPPAKRTQADVASYQADYRKRNIEAIRKMKRDWYFRVGKARRAARTKTKAKTCGSR